jgi:hypothetical protein
VPPASSKALGTKREYFFRNVFFYKKNISHNDELLLPLSKDIANLSRGG